MLFFNAESMAAGYADGFFKWLDPDDYSETIGSVDEPLGWCGLVHVDRDLIASYVSEAGDPWLSQRRNFAPGWYIVRIDSDGFVWGYRYADQHTAESDFAALCATHRAEVPVDSTSTARCTSEGAYCERICPRHHPTRYAHYLGKHATDYFEWAGVRV